MDTADTLHGPGDYPTTVLATAWNVSVMTGDGLPVLNVHRLREGGGGLEYHPEHDKLRFTCSAAAWSYAFCNGLIRPYTRKRAGEQR